MGTWEGPTCKSGVFHPLNRRSILHAMQAQLVHSWDLWKRRKGKTKGGAKEPESVAECPGLCMGLDRNASLGWLQSSGPILLNPNRPSFSGSPSRGINALGAAPGSRGVDCPSWNRTALQIEMPCHAMPCRAGTNRCTYAVHVPVHLRASRRPRQQQQRR